jgi:alpha-amylase/alpha-mannosidase (GH57 family)
MSNKLHVAFLWHMHQPYYVDTHRGAALMPWVRLHATKGYLDMIWLVERFPAFRCTFNLTPVLLKQIEQLARGEVRDRWHELAATPADSLTLEQKTKLLEHFFKANLDNLIRPHRRYLTLLQKRGVNPALADLPRLAGSFSTQEYRDLQVWFNLAWFGYAALRLYPEIAELRRKGEFFTEDDKQTLFAQQQDILENIIACYKARFEAGQIEISTTPFYHPIMPLVYNTEFARRCLPGAELPQPSFSHPEDVRAHLQMACREHRRLFGAAPTGLWPSEGAVCPEIIPILQELGLNWFATDEEILWRSLRATNPHSAADRNRLFQGHRAWCGDHSVCVAFRERTLSDFVGFTAARNEPGTAAKFIVNHLKEIARNGSGEGDLCPVILDGENAWESFADGGEAFLSELYGRLSEEADIVPTTFQDYFAQHPPRSNLHTLHTGSWINGDFRIWIGHPEDVQAWDVLRRTREFLEAQQARGELTADQYQRAMQEIYAAEGSDWFWWYGDDFATENDLMFDELFRTHLQNVYRILGAPVPDFLNVHICRSEVSIESHAPNRLITPVVDGRVTSYYEWSGAIVYEAGRAMGAMYQGNRVINMIHFGGNLENFYLRADFNPSINLTATLQLRIAFLSPASRSLTVSNFLAESPAIEWSQSEGSDETDLPESVSVQASYGRVLELAIPYGLLGTSHARQLNFVVQVLEGGIQLEQHPAFRAFNFDLPDTDTEARNWWV